MDEDNPYDDYENGFRLNLKSEDEIEYEDTMAVSMRRNWASRKKIYRLIKRTSFTIGAFRIDCSIVRSNRKGKNGRMIPTNRFIEAGVIQSPQSYEIEIEFLPTVVKEEGLDIMKVSMDYLKIIRMVLRLVRGSFVIIPKPTVDSVISNYGELMNITRSRPSLQDFAGPLPVTLEVSHLRAGLDDYTITEKTDGERCLMFINDNGHAYLITRTFGIEDCGIVFEDETLRRSLLDGERVRLTSDNTYLPLYLVFDC